MSQVPPTWVKLRSWFGVVPLSVYLVLHLGFQSSAIGGFRSYEAALGWTRSLPGRSILMLLGLYLPLAFHVVSGLYLAVRARQSKRAGEHVDGWQAQAASGVVLLGFLSVHLLQFPVRRWSGQLAAVDQYAELCATLSATRWGGVPLQAAGYLAGTCAAAYHVAQGFRDLLSRWAGRRAATRAAIARGSAVLGMLVFCTGALIVIELATGSLLFGSR